MTRRFVKVGLHAGEASRRQFLNQTALFSLGGLLGPQFLGAGIAIARSKDEPLIPIKSASVLVTRFMAEKASINTVLPDGLVANRDLLVVQWMEVTLAEESVPPFLAGGVFAYTKALKGATGFYMVEGWTKDAPIPLRNLRLQYGSEQVGIGSPAISISDNNKITASIHDSSEALVIELSASLSRPFPWVYGDPDGTYFTEGISKKADGSLVVRPIVRQFDDVQDLRRTGMKLSVGEKESVLHSMKMGDFHNGWYLQARNFDIGEPETIQ